MEEDLVYVDDHGLLGSNFYWRKHDAKGITKEEVVSVGVTNDRVQVHKDIIEALIAIDNTFKRDLGFRLYIKEGYRSRDLYNLVYEKRVQKFGKEETDKILNMEDMPHAKGLSVDVSLFDEDAGSEVYMRKGDDGIDALFVDFYKNSSSEESKRYHELQELVINTMQDHGFRLGKKREYFHFDYKPNAAKNY